MRSPRDGALRERAKRLFVERMLLVTASDSEMERALPKTNCAACNRPPIASEVKRYELNHLRRLDVVPGITGMASTGTCG